MVIGNTIIGQNRITEEPDEDYRYKAAGSFNQPGTQG